ncbi:hypothetical protein AGLY_007087 [Aphis glycines]|uniref:Uncharacterized protein n=1 Tax=Aphis glycines TaxID=307491 RepID=A0A6G0TRX0_APHGL|nr:hypothetical protein AGLY_007087 [Aphis glycines]
MLWYQKLNNKTIYFFKILSLSLYAIPLSHHSTFCNYNTYNILTKFINASQIYLPFLLLLLNNLILFINKNVLQFINNKSILLIVNFKFWSKVQETAFHLVCFGFDSKCFYGDIFLCEILLSFECDYHRCAHAGGGDNRQLPLRGAKFYFQIYSIAVKSLKKALLCEDNQIVIPPVKKRSLI